MHDHWTVMTEGVIRMPETLAASCPACGHALSDHGDDPVHAVSYCRRDCGCLVGVAAKSEAATIACPPCDDPAGHQYDDDRANLLWGWDGPWAKRGDPCIWCDHSKCAACPPPRGGTFAEEHSAGTEECWSDTCQMEQCRAYQTRRATQGESDV